MDLLDAIQWCVSHLPTIVMILAGTFIVLSQGPGLWAFIKQYLPSPQPTPIIPVPDTGEISSSATALLNGMLVAIPKIKEEKLHVQAVDACVKFAEAMIREVGQVDESK